MKLKYIFIILFFASCCKKNQRKEQPPIPTKGEDTTVVISPPVIKDTPRNVVCVGNSLVTGAGVDTGYNFPSDLRKLLESPVFNAGVSGITTWEMLNKPLYYDAVPKPQSGFKNIMVVWEIGNDIWQHGFDGAEDRFKTYTEKRKAEGWEIFVINLPYRDTYFLGELWLSQGRPTWPGFPEKNPSGQDTTLWQPQIDEVNTWLVEEYGNHLIDVAQYFKDYDPLYYQPDHTHFTKEGYTIIANEVYKKIKQ